MAVPLWRWSRLTWSFCPPAVATEVQAKVEIAILQSSYQQGHDESQDPEHEHPGYRRQWDGNEQRHSGYAACPDSLQDQAAGHPGCARTKRTMHSPALRCGHRASLPHGDLDFPFCRRPSGKTVLPDCDQKRAFMFGGGPWFLRGRGRVIGSPGGPVGMPSRSAAEDPASR
jgi:hypothetical protein